MSNDTENLNVTLEGAKSTAIYTERKTTIFAVNEIELDTISFINDASTLLASFGTFSLTEFFGNIKIRADGYLWYFDPLGWITLILFGLAIIAFLKKKSIIDKIKEQCL